MSEQSRGGIDGGVPAGPWQILWRRLKRNRLALAAFGVVVLIAVLALGAEAVAPYGYKDQFRGGEQQAPNSTKLTRRPGDDAPAERYFLLGTDANARDVFSRIVYGARVSLAVGLLATLVSLVIGLVVGLLSGFYGGWIDACLMRFTDTVFAFPSVLLAVAITATVDKPSLEVVFLALGLVGWTGIARVVRSQVLTIKTQDFVVASRALGARGFHVLVRQILPNCWGPVIVVTTLAIGGNILGEAGLSFLGLGVQEPYPSWGGMLADAQERYKDAWWLGVFPGLMIVVTVLAFNLFGDGLRDALDPRHSRK